jgi:hypothetical protein
MPPAKPRFDGWTPDRQLVFLETLARTRSVSAASISAGMSRESAYRLRRRAGAGLFAAAWDRAMGVDRVTLTRAQIVEGHTRLIARACGTEGANLRLRLAEPSNS